MLTSKENNIEFTHFSSFFLMFSTYYPTCSLSILEIIVHEPILSQEYRQGNHTPLVFHGSSDFKYSAHSSKNGLQFLAEKYYHQKYKTEYSESLPQSLGNVLLNSLFNKLNLIDVHLRITIHKVLWDRPT